MVILSLSMVIRYSDDEKNENINKIFFCDFINHFFRAEQTKFPKMFVMCSNNIYFSYDFLLTENSCKIISYEKS